LPPPGLLGDEPSSAWRPTLRETAGSIVIALPA
jgi:hypothetical protein